MEDLLKEVIAAGGSRLLIPAVLFVLVLYAIRGLSGLHGRRSQNRKDFLDLWDSTRSQDHLWLEVVIRHLFGSYLPARIIRLALAQPDKAQSLLNLAELWPLFRFDPTSETASWLHKCHETSKRRTVGIRCQGQFSEKGGRKRCQGQFAGNDTAEIKPLPDYAACDRTCALMWPRRRVARSAARHRSAG